MIRCDSCNSLTHTAHFCPKAKLNPVQNNPVHSKYRGSFNQLDVQGRPRLTHKGKEICNNFNGENGCNRQSCNLVHNYLLSLQARETCIYSVQNRCQTKRQKYNGETVTRKYIPSIQKTDSCVKRNTCVTPIDIMAFKLELEHHPDRDFVNTFINGLERGFDTGIAQLPATTLECKNLSSARKNPDVVDNLLKYELDKGYLDGPFEKPPYDVYRISPIGVVEGKNSKKYRLIVNLSSPHKHISEVSINSLIDKEDYSSTFELMMLLIF